MYFVKSPLLKYLYTFAPSSPHLPHQLGWASPPCAFGWYGRAIPVTVVEAANSRQTPRVKAKPPLDVFIHRGQTSSPSSNGARRKT